MSVGYARSKTPLSALVVPFWPGTTYRLSSARYLRRVLDVTGVPGCPRGFGWAERRGWAWPQVSSWLVVVGLSVVAVIGGLASGGVSSWEVELGRRAHDLPPPVQWPLVIAMQVGTRGAIAVVALAAGLRWGRRAGITVLTAGAAAWALSAGLKLLEVRGRPTEGQLGRSISESVAGAGLPSTHSAVAVGLVAILALDRRCPNWLAAVAGVLALATMTARLSLGVHWGLDVLAGAAIGATAAIAAHGVFARCHRR
jgi:hypothetical protein